jgi:hypothetical protein
MKLKKYTFALLTLLLILSACESTNLDLQNDPHQLTPESANPDYVLNGLLVGINFQTYNLSNMTEPIIRHTNQFGTYTNSIQGLTQDSMNSAWEINYRMMNNLNIIKDISETKNLLHHVAIGKIVNAMAIINLVDYLGSSVFSEAVDSDNFPFPGLDNGEDIYNQVYTILDESINLLHQDAAYTPDDIYFHGDINKWEKLANSIKIKMLIQSRKANGFNNADASSIINNIVSSGKYISGYDDDFEFVYGTNEVSPDNRHPRFVANYQGSPDDYMSNDFMSRLVNGLNVNDPRLNAYIYRQTSQSPGSFIDDCTNAGFGSDCYIGNGYWGRLHADESGIPNDNLLRATYGAYPIGGAFDDGQFLSVHDDTLITMKGAGINPIITSSNINFYIAEAILTIPGVNGNALDYLSYGMQDSFDKVSNFTGHSLSDVPVYKQFVVDSYNATVSNEDKLKIVVNQNYIASFGNGIEPYNSYRRTGYPDFNLPNFQNPGLFPRSMFLPKSELDSNDNPSLVQKLLTDQVFWDTNAAGFID